MMQYSWLLIILHNTLLASAFSPITFKSIKSSLSLHSTSSALYSKEVFKWIQSVGDNCISPSIEIDANGICKAISSIKKGETIFSIPQGLTLDIPKATTKLGSQLSSNNLKTGDIGALALLLLSEKYSKESKYKSYLNSLPQSPPGILGWTESEIRELLQSTSRDIESQLKAIELDYNYILSVLQKKGNNVITVNDFTMEEFKWAVGIVKARVIYLDNKANLVPGIDHLKFDPFSTSEPFLANSGLFGGKVVKLNTDQIISKGEEIFVSFGLKSSAECLEDHGIVPQIELDDASAEITIKIDENDIFQNDKERTLEDAGYPSKERFDIESSSEIDPMLIKFLRLKLIDGKDAFILEACFSDTIWSTMSFPFSKNNELKVYNYLKEIFMSILEMINNTNSEELDKEILSTINIDDKNINEIDRRKSLLAELRQQERAAFKGALSNVLLEIKILEGGGLDTREYYQERRLRELNLLRPLEESEIVMPDADRGRGGL